MLKYEKVAQSIEQEVAKLEEGSKLPVIAVLKQKYAVSQSTIIKALQLLEEKGTVYQRRGSGIFVRKRRRKGYLQLEQEITGEYDASNVTFKLLQFERCTPDEDILANLNLSRKREVYYIKRIRYMAQPVCIEEIYLDKAFIPFLNKEIVLNGMFDYLRNGLGVRRGFLDMYIQSGLLTTQEANHLKVTKRESKLTVEANIFLKTGEVFQYARFTYPEYQGFVI